MTTFIDASVHSLERLKERSGKKNSREAARYLNNAVSRGKRAEDFASTAEKRYLEKKNSRSENHEAIVYDGNCFIFSESTCITMFPLPAWFGKKKFYDGKEKIRHPHRYQRYCVDGLSS